MSSVLMPNEGLSVDRVFRKPIMSRPSKTSVVAGRIAVAPQPKPGTGDIGDGNPALDMAAQVVAEAIEQERVSGPSSQPPQPRVRKPSRSRRTPSKTEREQAERSLERRIRAHLSRGELSVTLTDNRYTMISVRRETKGVKRYKVRLHHMFANSSPMITKALARYISLNDRDASKQLGDFIDANQQFVRTRARRTVEPKLVTKGQFHDLGDIYDFLNARYFGNAIDARITWGQKNRKPIRRNSIKMGSYSVEDKLIRIHRSLDRAFVPRFFVEWVVYHEMLHQVHAIKVVNGRRMFHSREFLRDEAKFDHYGEARAWERANLDALLTY